MQMLKPLFVGIYLKPLVEQDLSFELDRRDEASIR